MAVVVFCQIEESRAFTRFHLLASRAGERIELCA
jgi:hypothetical protein